MGTKSLLERVNTLESDLNRVCERLLNLEKEEERKRKARMGGFKVKKDGRWVTDLGEENA